MAESDFNFGPNFPPGGAPENPRVNSAAFDAELKKAQQLQTETIKSLTNTIEELNKKYEELNNTNKKLSEEEITASKLLKDKISVLTEILSNLKSEANRGTVAPLTNIGIKERTESFDKFANVIKSYQVTAADIKNSGGGELDFDAWFAGYIEQQKISQLSLLEQQNNNLLLNDVKTILKESNTSLSDLSDEELELLTRRTVQLSVEQGQRELRLLEQNKDIIKLNKDATAQDIKNTKELISSRNFDPTKVVVEKGFKGVTRDLDKIIENTKPRSLLKIVLDLMGPFGAVISFFIKLVVYPLMFSLGILAGFFIVQFAKFKTIANILSGDVFLGMIKSLLLVKNALVFTFRDMPLIIASFINNWTSRVSQLYEGITKTSKFFSYIAGKSEAFFFAWTRMLKFIELIPSRLSAWYEIFKNFELNISKLSKFEKVYVVIGDVVVAISKLIPKIGTILSPIASIGRGMESFAASIGDLTIKLFTPITNFFSGGVGKILLILDRFGFGIGNVLRLGISVGKYIGGVLAPLSAVISVLAGMPTFFKNLFSGNFYTMVKSIMALIVQIGGMVLATVFGGPIGGLVAAMTLKLENIMKWFDPIFDTLIYAGALVLGFIYSLYKDFVDPALTAISKVIISVLNLAFSLLKPVFKVVQFILILLAPLFGLVMVAFKGLGYIFKAIGALADLFTEYVVDPFTKFMEYFLFKFIQPLYDFIADSFIGKMLGMETAKDRKEREAAEAARKKKKEETEEKGFSFTIPSLEGQNIDFGFNAQDVTSGIGKTKEFVSNAVDSSANMIKNTASSLKTISQDFSDSIYHLSDTLKTQLTPITNTMIELGKSFGMRATEFGVSAVDKINTPTVRTVLTNLTTPIPSYATASTIVPSIAPAENRMAQEYQMMSTLLQKASMDSSERAANNTINNQQTTVVNNTNGGPTMVMPSNSERTINTINSSVRPSG